MPSIHTNGFSSGRLLLRHFAKHASDLGLNTVNEFEETADRFLGRAKPVHVLECRRRNDDAIRFDPHTELYGILGLGGVIRTCFKPIPCSSVPRAQRAQLKQEGKCHSQPSNLDYFRSECAK